ncbi:hypothetical protein HK098_006585 [Nowakowskiella sp. JEL0407]|nr:hypothetical protein HK098_006585 [Nowakowskiella sp. JEL0407]
MLSTTRLSLPLSLPSLLPPLSSLSKEKDSLVSDTKAEIRALKGLLLSSRNFPAVKRTGGLVGSKPKSDDDIGSVASGNSFVNPLANPTEDRASALSSSPSGNTSLGPSRPVGTDDRGSALTNSTSGNTSLVNGNTGPSLASSRRISFPTDSALTSPSGNTSLGSSRRVSIPKDEKSGIPRIVSPHDSPTRKPSFQKDTDKDSSLLGQYFLESGSNTTKRKSVDSLLPVRSDRRFSKPSTLQVVNDVESKVESFDPLVQVPPGQPVDETPVPTDTDTALHGENIQEDSNVSLETPNHSSTALLDEDIQVASDVSSETPTFVPTFDNAIEPVSHDSGNFEIYKPTPNTDATSVVENISPDIEKHATTSDHTTAQPGTVEPSQVSKLNSDTVSSLSNSEAVDEPGDGDLEDVNEVSGSGSDKKKKKKNKKKKGK